MLALRGAAPLPLIAVTSWRRGEPTSRRASPPSWPLHGSTTVSTAPAAIAASIALPPSRRTASPAALASGLTLAIMPCGARRASWAGQPCSVTIATFPAQSMRGQPIAHHGVERVVLQVNRDRMARALEPDQLLVHCADAPHDVRGVRDVDRAVVAAVHDQRRRRNGGQLAVDDAEQLEQALDAHGRTAGVTVEQP